MAETENDSPPMPAAQALNQMRIEESWEHFEKSTSLDVSTAIGNGPFSVDVNASQTGQLTRSILHSTAHSHSNKS